MAHAYTPGLKVTEKSVIRKRRQLPLTGEVVVHTGDTVRASDVIARTALPGKVHPLSIANLLGFFPRKRRHFSR